MDELGWALVAVAVCLLVGAGAFVLLYKVDAVSAMTAFATVASLSVLAVGLLVAVAVRRCRRVLGDTQCQA